MACTLRELCHAFDDVLQHPARGKAAYLENRLLETLHTELSGLGAFGFGHAVDVD
jgi:hypothetical protein